MKRYIFILFCAFYLGGCASAAKVESMVYAAEGGAGSYSEALMGNISVRFVAGGQKTNPALTSKISNSDFNEALKMSLINEGLFGANGQYQIDASILEVSAPMVGMSMSGTTRVKYTLSEKSQRAVILDRTLSTTRTATPSDAIVAAARQRMAVEMSARENIVQFLRALSAIDVATGDGATGK